MDKTSVIIILILVILVAGFFYFIQPKNINMNENQNQQTEENQNSTNFNVQGMNVEILQQGSGEPTKSGDKVTVNYVGTLQDGTKFDSSIDRGQPFVFTLGQNSVIQGWELGVIGMKVGEKRKLTIPSELAYDEAGAGGIIPPNATLIFEIDLLEIN
ncbi:MAG: FKBP-type peptidyl-prolyl cis-trans isomerase [bacterium]